MRLFHSFINATQFYHNDYYSFCASTKKRFIVCIDILMPVLGNLVIICLTFMCVFSLHRKDMIFVILLRVLQDAHNLVCGYNLDVKKIKAPSLLNLLSHARIEQFLGWVSSETPCMSLWWTDKLGRIYHNLGMAKNDSWRKDVRLSLVILFSVSRLSLVILNHAWHMTSHGWRIFSLTTFP